MIIGIIAIIFVLLIFLALGLARCAKEADRAMGIDPDDPEP